MLDRMHNAKVANDELKNFYAARAAIEDEYARKLLNLSRKPLGSAESGTLRLSCDVIRTEVESMGKAHQSIAQQMKTELEEPLAAFAGGMKERRKIVQNGIEKLLKLPSFRQAYEFEGMKPSEFAQFGAFQATATEFAAATRKTVDFVRMTLEGCEAQ